MKLRLLACLLCLLSVAAMGLSGAMALDPTEGLSMRVYLWGLVALNGYSAVHSALRFRRSEHKE